MTLVLGLVEERNLSPSRKTKNAICEKECSFYSEKIFF